MSAQPAPSVAELARTAVEGARRARVVPLGTASQADAWNSVAVSADASGRPLLRLHPLSPLVTALTLGTGARVDVAAHAPFRSVSLSGPLRRQRTDPRDGRILLRLLVREICLKATRPVPVPIHDYYTAEPDPLAGDAPAALEHLAEHHAYELTACVRANGYTDALWAIPRGLDRYGLELALLTRDGVTTTRLAFPNAPISDLSQASASLRIALTAPRPRRQADGSEAGSG